MLFDPRTDKARVAHTLLSRNVRLSALHKVDDRFALERKWLPIIATLALVIRLANTIVSNFGVDWTSGINAALYVPILLLPWVVQLLVFRAFLAALYVIQAVFMVLNAWMSPPHHGNDGMVFLSGYMDVCLVYVAFPVIFGSGCLYLGRRFPLRDEPGTPPPETAKRRRIRPK